MRTLRLVRGPESGESFGTADRASLVQALRLLFLTAILLAVIFQQSIQPNFIHLEWILAFYSLLTVSFLLSGLQLLFQERLARHAWVSGALFAYDALAITGLLYASGINRSMLLFLYLVNILLCGQVFDRFGAFLLALWTSLLFSVLLILGPSVGTGSAFLALAINNLAFFAVAYLSGAISEQIRELGAEIAARGRDIEALQDLNELIVDNIATGLLTLDLSGEVTHSNRAALRILDDVRLTGRSLEAIFPDLAARLTPALFASGESLKRFEYPYRDTRQERLIIEVIASPMRAGDGSLRGYILLLQDLTQVKQYENALRQKEKLAAVGQLAAGIAHEIRNPLASISGSIQLMSANLKPEAVDDAKLMKITLREIDRLNGLIAEFLEYVRPDVRREDPIDVKAVLREVLDMCRVNPTLRREVEQKLQLESHKMILGSYDKLKQAFLNITINAYQAMEKSGEARLTVQTYDLERGVVVVIRDTGVGIPEANIRRIFEPFHTTKNGGTGLGLAITHKILESHEARFRVESEIGRGTAFIMEFPASDDTHQDEMPIRKQA